MKTFRFTVPEMPLTAREKLGRCRSRSGSHRSDYWVAYMAYAFGATLFQFVVGLLYNALSEEFADWTAELLLVFLASLFVGSFAIFAFTVRRLIVEPIIRATDRPEASDP